MCSWKKKSTHESVKTALKKQKYPSRALTLLQVQGKVLIPICLQANQVYSFNSFFSLPLAG